MKGNVIFTAAQWADIRGVTCMGSEGFDCTVPLTIDSVIDILVEEYTYEKNHVENAGATQFSGVAAGVGANSGAGGGGDGVDSFQRRRKPDPSSKDSIPSTISINASSSSSSSAEPVSGGTEGVAAGNGDEDAKARKKSEHEAAALRRLQATSSWLSGSFGGNR